MPSASSDERAYDVRGVFASAMAIPFPKIIKQPPTERETRLETIIANLEQHNAQVRSNFAHLSATQIANLPAPPSYPPSSTTLATRNANLIAHISLPPQAQPTTTTATATNIALNKPIFTPDAEGSAFPVVAAAMQDTEKVMMEFEKRAEEGLKIYKDALMREREQKAQREKEDNVGASGGGTGEKKVDEGSGERKFGEGMQQRRNSMPATVGEPSLGGTVVDASRDPRRRGGGG